MEDHPESDVVQLTNALAQQWAEETAENRQTEDVTVGAIGIIYELKWPDGATAISYICSDPRPWVASGLFRSAMLTSDDASSEDED